MFLDEKQIAEAMYRTLAFNDEANRTTLRRMKTMTPALLVRYLDAGQQVREKMGDAARVTVGALEWERHGVECAVVLHLDPVAALISLVMDEAADHEGLGFAPWGALEPGQHKCQISVWFSNPLDALRDWMRRAEIQTSKTIRDFTSSRRVLQANLALVGPQETEAISYHHPAGTIGYKGGIYDRTNPLVTAALGLATSFLAPPAPTPAPNADPAPESKEDV